LDSLFKQTPASNLCKIFNVQQHCSKRELCQKNNYISPLPTNTLFPLEPKGETQNFHYFFFLLLSKPKVARKAGHEIIQLPIFFFLINHSIICHCTQRYKKQSSISVYLSADEQITDHHSNSTQLLMSSEIFVLPKKSTKSNFIHEIGFDRIML
jgi:hypothetical protein